MHDNAFPAVVESGAARARSGKRLAAALSAAVLLTSAPSGGAEGAQGGEIPPECRRQLNPVELYKNPEFLDTIRRCLNQQPPQEGVDDADCLPQADPQMIERLQRERNPFLRELAMGGYMTDLTLTTMGKLVAARLHHLTEPNEGIAVRAARGAQRAWEYAPEAVVNAGKAVAAYLTNDVEANHRYLHGQVDTWVNRAEADLKQKLRNPHIAIATVAEIRSEAS